MCLLAKNFHTKNGSEANCGEHEQLKRALSSFSQSVELLSVSPHCGVQWDMCTNTKNLMTKASKKRKGQKIIAKKKISIDETKATHIDKCKSFTKVISHKSEFLLTGCGCTPEEINAHCSNVALKVVCRSKEGSHNGELDKIPLFHVQVWLGELRFNVNEFRATTHMSTQRVPLDRVPPKATRNFWDQCVDNHPYAHAQQTHGTP